MHRSVPRPPPSPRPANVSSSSGMVLFIVIVPGSRLRSRRNVAIGYLVLYLRQPRRHRRIRRLYCIPRLPEPLPVNDVSWRNFPLCLPLDLHPLAAVLVVAISR